VSTTLESSPRRREGAPPTPATAAWRDRLARRAVTAALFLTILAAGGGLYEHLVVDPVWPANATVIQPDRGGVNRKVFWVPLHAALTLALPLALWAAWRRPAPRRWLLAAVGAYVALRAWTFAYFVPLALRFEAEGVPDAAAAHTWVLLSTLRLPLVLASLAALWMAARRLDDERPAERKKGYKGLAMEGFIARWYARTTGKRMEEFTKLARDLAGKLPGGGSVLEVAPGPGYLAIELARLGAYRVVGLDISQSFVRMAAASAEQAGVEVVFRHGDAAAMPFEPDSFDLVVCRAAFKNFTEPVEALNEMHRVLRPGGQALIIDLRSDAPAAAIAAHVKEMGLGRINSFVVKFVLRQLLRRAYSQEQFRQMVSRTPFKGYDVREDSIGLEVSLTK
jgi:ubiquinone/menaquinone biosynthesis C-methylase UbiE